MRGIRTYFGEEQGECPFRIYDNTNRNPNNTDQHSSCSRNKRKSPQRGLTCIPGRMKEQLFTQARLKFPFDQLEIGNRAVVHPLNTPHGTYMKRRISLVPDREGGARATYHEFPKRPWMAIVLAR